ncbi:hypothetical protein [Deinococcus apachensis]|uniref:hypothetical protein n=1 Tax=Deinococcus apachensis TaxID=309886 RepID=UPI00035DA15C|nr:hypothetical protein [Deinococcus apachensis]
MTTSPTPGGRGDQSSTPPLNTPTPCALDFAQLLHARQEVERRAQTYLAELQTQIQAALEQRGYEDIRVRPLDGPPTTPDEAGGVTWLVLMRLPLDGLKSPVFRVQLPLAVTYGGELRVQGAQINEFTVPEVFVHPLGTDVGHVAEMLVQGLSQRYMDHLVHTGGRSTLTPGADPRRQYIADWD